MNKIKLMLSTILVSVFTLASMINVNALEIDKLESGIYEVENDTYHESDLGREMSRSYTLPTMKIEKSKEGIFYTVGFTGTDYMENYRIFIDDKDVKCEIVEENAEEKTIYLRFETKTTNPTIQAKIYVDPMGRDVEFNIVAKPETIKLIEKIEEAEESNVNKASKTSTALIIIGAISVVIFAVIKLKR